MKVIWIGGLLSLLVLVAFGRLSADPGGVWKTPAGTRALPSAAAPSPKSPGAVVTAGAPAGAEPDFAQKIVGAGPVSASAHGSIALTMSDYVLLHRTRSEGMPEPAHSARRTLLK